MRRKQPCHPRSSLLTSPSNSTNMESSKEFTVSSGAICFGPLRDVLRASRTPIQTPPEPPAKPVPDGIPFIKQQQQMEHNVPAQNGTWTALPLVTMLKPHRTTAWFVAHSDVDPATEIDKILRVAGSPFEDDFGVRYNRAESRAANLWLVNQEDWDDIPRGEADEFPRLTANSEYVKQEGDAHANRGCIALTDYAHGEELAQGWRGVNSHRRQQSEHGLWLHTPGANRPHVRIGFDDNYQRARSLLFFSQGTNFYGVSRATVPFQRLRTRESPQEEYRRKLSQGEDYSGLDWLYSTAPDRNYVPPNENITVKPSPPLETHLCGPYPRDLYLFSPEDLEAIRASVPPVAPLGKFWGMALHITVPVEHDPPLEQAIFAEEFADTIYELINELILSYIECVAPTIRRARSAAALGQALFPRPEDTTNRGEFVPYDTRSYLSRYEGQATELVDTLVVEDKLHAFVRQHAGPGWIDPNAPEISLLGLVNVCVYMVEQMIDRACPLAIGRKADVPTTEDCLITPHNIRESVYNNREGLIEMTKRSVVFWRSSLAAAGQTA